MIQLFYNFIPILPILLLIITTVLIILLVSFVSKCNNIVCIISFLGILGSIILILMIQKNNFYLYSEMFIFDKFSRLSMIILLMSSLYTCIFACSWLNNYYDKQAEFYIFLLISTIGGLIVLISFHISMLFVGIELFFLPILGLLGYSNDLNRKLFLILKYMILSVFSTILMLFGFILVYSMSGNLSFLRISNMFLYHPEIMLNINTILGLLIFFLSFCFKLSIFPMHLWILDIYQYINSYTLIYFSVASKIVIFTFLMRFFLYLPSLYYINIIYIFLVSISILSIIFGNFMAFFQKNINRLIGYSSVTNLGFLFILILLSIDKSYIINFQAIYIYIFGYFFSLICFFSIKSYIEYNNFSKNLLLSYNNSLKGLFWKNPFLCYIMTMILLSFSGFPMTIGFLGKFYIFNIIIQKKFYILMIFIMISNIVGTQCYIPIIHNLYLYNDKYLIYKKYSSIKILLKVQFFFIVVLGLVLFFLGIYPQWILTIISIF